MKAYLKKSGLITMREFLRKRPQTIHVTISASFRDTALLVTVLPDSNSGSMSERLNLYALVSESEQGMVTAGYDALLDLLSTLGESDAEDDEDDPTWMVGQDRDRLYFGEVEWTEGDTVPILGDK